MKHITIEIQEIIFYLIDKMGYYMFRGDYSAHGSALYHLKQILAYGNKDRSFEINYQRLCNDMKECGGEVPSNWKRVITEFMELIEEPDFADR